MTIEERANSLMQDMRDLEIDTAVKLVDICEKHHLKLESLLPILDVMHSEMKDMVSYVFKHMQDSENADTFTEFPIDA